MLVIIIWCTLGREGHFVFSIFLLETCPPWPVPSSGRSFDQSQGMIVGTWSQYVRDLENVWGPMMPIHSESEVGWHQKYYYYYYYYYLVSYVKIFYWHKVTWDSILAWNISGLPTLKSYDTTKQSIRRWLYI